MSVGLPSRPEAVRIARQAVERLRGHVDEDALDNLRLLVSEVVTNSIRHGARTADEDCIQLKVFESPKQVRVEVADPGRGFPPNVHLPREGQTSGWGLFLVDRIADEWGVSPGGGTTVWFEVPRESKERHER